MEFPGGPMVKKLPANAGTQVPSLGWEDSPGEGNGYSLQYSNMLYVTVYIVYYTVYT